jgi:hypothetical protein
MLARVLRAGALAVALIALPSAVRAQDSAVRMEIKTVGDSTFSFNATNVPWVARGQNGIVVDPRRRDVLVARFKVLSVEDGTGNALILGQTQRVSTDHMALLSEPRPAWYTRRTFWGGLLVGLAAGFGLGKL